MTQYRSRRAVVEAMQFTKEACDEVSRWVASANRWQGSGTSYTLSIEVGGDWIIAELNDWVIRLGENEYEVLSSKVFADKYEPFAESPESYGRVHSTEEARELELNQGVKDPKKETKE